jgi:hypothetical protein
MSDDLLEYIRQKILDGTLPKQTTWYGPRRRLRGVRAAHRGRRRGGRVRSTRRRDHSAPSELLRHLGGGAARLRSRMTPA